MDNSDESMLDDNVEYYTVLNSATIKGKLSENIFSVSERHGRSEVWKTFGRIQNEAGKNVDGFVVCRRCRNVYKFRSKSTSNLVRHKCYIQSKLDVDKTNIVKKDLDTECKKECAKITTKWILQDYRPYKIIQDPKFKEFAEFLLSVGSKYGANVDIDQLLPHCSTLGHNIEKLYSMQKCKLKEDLESIKDVGFAITCDLWTDKYLLESYLACTIHYIRDGKIFNKFLGMKSMNVEKCTGRNIKCKVSRLLQNFDLTLEHNYSVLTDRDFNMISAFGMGTHVICINSLLNNCIEKSLESISEVNTLCENSRKLVKYLKKSCGNIFISINCSQTRWNSTYYVILSLMENWNEITQYLEERNELFRINNINPDLLKELVPLLHHFEEITETLQKTSCATMHLVLVCIHKIKKACSENPDDIDIIKNFKIKLVAALNGIVLKNTKLEHKIALFLFPPANKLIQFSVLERKVIKKECKRLLMYLAETNEDAATITIEPKYNPLNGSLFEDFIQPTHSQNQENTVSSELESYESMNITIREEFDVLQWWHLHSSQFPLLYKLSCIILASPATCSSVESIFLKARNLLSDKCSTIGKNCKTVNQIMFINYNEDITENFDNSEFDL